MRAIALLVLVLLCDCAAFVPSCRAEGGSPWWSTRSEHFTVETNLDRHEALEAVALLERLSSAIAHFSLLERVAAITAQPVVVIRSPAQFAALSGQTTRSGFTRDLGDQQLIVISAHSEALLSDVFEVRLVAHELTHQLLAQRAPSAPRWLSEGLALYLETIELEDDGHATIGKLNTWHQGFIKDGGLASPAKLWTWDGRDLAGNDAWLYSTSWLALHYLITNRPAQLVAFLQLLGDRAPPRGAWAEVFPDLNDERFAATLADYAAVVVEHLTRVDWKPGALHAAPEALGDVEVHLLQAMATLAPTIARSEVAKALAHDPHHQGARVMQAELSGDAQQLAELAIDFPHSAGVRRLLGSRSLDLFQRERRLRGNLYLHPEDPTAQVELAATLVAQGNFSAAEPYARLALEKRPADQRVIRVWAAVVAGTGHCAEAIAQQRLALARLSDDADPTERSHATERLNSYLARCEQDSPASRHETPRAPEPPTPSPALR